MTGIHPRDEIITTFEAYRRLLIVEKRMGEAGEVQKSIDLLREDK